MQELAAKCVANLSIPDSCKEALVRQGAIPLLLQRIRTGELSCTPLHCMLLPFPSWRFPRCMVILFPSKGSLPHVPPYSLLQAPPPPVMPAAVPS